jgi:osmotically-inducible protein OsmY
MKRALLLFCMLLPLSGCVAAAFLVGATAGGVILSDKRSTSTMVDDSKITATANDRLNQALKDHIYIEIATFNNVVLMVGDATTTQYRDQAYKIVSGIPGVKKVYNQVSIGKPYSFNQNTEDNWITTKVKSAMLAQSGLRSAQIKVVSSNNTVYLMGLVTHDQGDLAANVAREISGVKAVYKVLEYLP